jgi:hypothetical protein
LNTADRFRPDFLPEPPCSEDRRSAAARRGCAWDIHVFAAVRYPAGVGGSEEMPDVRVGDQERASAQAALAEHLTAGRLDLGEFTQRVDRCLTARTRRELLALFDDLPQPLPHLPATTAGAIMPGGSQPLPTAAVEDVQTATTTFLASALGVTIMLGIPAAAVLGFAYGAWWTLWIPVAVAVLLAIAQGMDSHRAHR